MPSGFVSPPAQGPLTRGMSGNPDLAGMQESAYSRFFGHGKLFQDRVYAYADWHKQRGPSRLAPSPELMCLRVLRCVGETFRFAVEKQVCGETIYAACTSASRAILAMPLQLNELTMHC
eukprot:1194735-Prorocentrum_minimum.AAC.3